MEPDVNNDTGPGESQAFVTIDSDGRRAFDRPGRASRASGPFGEGQARWVLEKLHRWQAQEPWPTPRQFVSGETFLYLGRQYRFRVAPSDEPGGVKLNGGWLIAPVDGALNGPQRAEAVRTALEAWYRDRAAQRLPERVQAWLKAAGGRAIGDVIISDQRRRWASCDAKGSLRFNWRVIQAPLRLVDYVVAHELVHLLHPHHGKQFWAALELAQPDFAHRRAELGRLGSKVEW